MKGNMIDSMC